MIPRIPEEYPNTILTLSAYPDLNRQITRSPDVYSLDALRRISDTRWRIYRRMQAARNAVIREQLAQIRRLA